MTSRILFLFFSFSFVFLTSCTEFTNQVATVILGEGQVEDAQGFCSRQRNCYSQATQVTFESVYPVDSGNIKNYILSGECKENDLPVDLRVQGCPIDVNLKCSGRKWKVGLNLISKAAKAEVVQFQVSHNGETICKDAQVAYEGETNYISVKSGYDDLDSFYVMKYEAKLGSDGKTPESRPDGEPITGVSWKQAKDYCESIDNRHSLMNNSQWQSLAWLIESDSRNWNSERNQINCGVVRGKPQEAKANDLDDCGASGGRCDTDWDVERRAHYLPDGQIIWDLCGNVAEIMEDPFPEDLQDKRFSGYAHSLTGDLKALFGPKRFYSSSSSSSSGNYYESAIYGSNSNYDLGYINIDKNKDMIVRGAPSVVGSSGIFSADVISDQAGSGFSYSVTNYPVGFRCVLIP